ncbi:MAG: insulinase family protein [Gammaproteobacteria bacterium]|nr:insulinase family protein [Gammaproteobacteria bacterium]
MLSKFKQMKLLVVLMLFSGLAQAIPDIEKWQTGNGARVMFVHVNGLPMLDVRVIFDAGSARDDGLSGLAALTNGLLAEGAGGQSAQVLAEQFESVGAQLENDSLRDMAIVGVRSLTDKVYLDTALATLSTVLSQPDFNQKEFDRELARMKVAVTARKQSPSAIADEAFYRAIYGDHPYAAPSGGTDESMERLNLDAIKAFYQKYYVAKNAQIVIVGAVERPQAEVIANSLSMGLAIGEKAAPIPEVSALKESKLIRIQYPSKQAHIYVGQPGMKRGDKDYFSLYMANHPFGGSGFASRLVETIREDRGLAYSVYSYFSPMREAGPFMMGLQTRADQADQAVSLLQSELEKYIAEGPADDELADSISNVVGSFPLNLDSNGKLMGYLAMIGFYDLPDDYLQKFVEHVESVSPADAKEAMARRIKTDKLVTVIVGDIAADDVVIDQGTAEDKKVELPQE